MKKTQFSESLVGLSADSYSQILSLKHSSYQSRSVELDGKKFEVMKYRM